MALVNFAQGLALMFNSLVNSVAMNNIGWKYYIVYCVFLVVMILVVFFFFPETRGRSLEELASVFDEGQRAWKTQKSQVNHLSQDERLPEKESCVETIEKV